MAEKICPYWWHRGDHVYYACRYPEGHEGPHRTVHFEIPTIQDDWSLDDGRVAVGFTPAPRAKRGRGRKDV